MDPRRRLPAVELFLALALLAGACTAPAQPSVDEKDLAPEAQSTKIFAADGSLITTLRQEENREVIPIDQIPDHLQKAVVAIEDSRFFNHQGFDAKAILRALYRNAVEGEIIEGGSTITQQLVRNSLEDVGKEQTIERKIREASYAYQVESTLSKEKILELYVNTVYFGEGAYGVQTAAQTYFGKNVQDLTLAEAALLAALIKAPVRYNPYTDLESAILRRNLVLDRMFLLGFATQKDVAEAKGAPVEIQEKKVQVRYPYAYFVDYVTRLIQHSDNFPQLGESVADRANVLFRGGLRIHTTLDPQAQKAAEKAVATVLDRPDDPSAALVAIESKTGHVRALVGGRDFFASKEADPCVIVGAVNADGSPKTCAKVNLALGRLGGGSGRQTGSAFKPFVLAAALDRGIPLTRTYRAPSCLSIAGADAGGTRPWRVCNYGLAGYSPMNLTRATALSINTVYAQLIMDVGPARVVEVARRMGVQSPLAAVPSATLGVNAMSPLEMASGFTVFPNLGTFIEPIAITKITDAAGNIVWKPQQLKRQAISQAAAYLALQAMQESFTYGTASRNRIGRPAFAKTGTNEDWRDAWFVGGAGTDLVAAVAVFWPDFEIAMVPSCTGQRTGYVIQNGTAIPPQCRPTRLRVTGGTFPGQIWQAFMLEALEGVPASRFPEVRRALISVEVDVSRGCLPNPYTPEELIRSQTFIRGTEPTEVCTEPEGPPQTQVPDVVGFPLDEAIKLLEKAGFEFEIDEEESQLYPPDRVIKQSPGAGSEVEEGATVTLTVSKTPTKKVPNVLGNKDTDAIETLEDAGYKVLVDREEGCAKGADSCAVSAQDPEAGTRAPVGSEVTIFVTKKSGSGG